MADWVAELSGPEVQQRVRAAVAIGHDRPQGGVAALLEQLAREKNVVGAAACCAALEMIGDRSAVPELLRQLSLCPENQVWDIAHALGRLAGMDPLVAPGAPAALLRDTWLEAAKHAPRATVRNAQTDGELLRFAVDGGSGRIRFDYDPPRRDTVSSPRWGRSLFVGDRPLYDVGSTCGTCETVLNLVGWPKERAFDAARQMSASIEDTVELSAEWIHRWSPLLLELQTGHYLGAKLRLPVERVNRGERSWLTLRRPLRQDTDRRIGARRFEVSWTGARHYQGPTFAEPRTFWTLLPSQDTAALDNSQVEHYVEQIRRQRAPTVLALGWMEDRYVEGEWQERFVVLFILDGHHKTEAYARSRRPAQLVALFHLENTWGPREDPSNPLVEAIRQLHGEEGKLSQDIINLTQG